MTLTWSGMQDTSVPDFSALLRSRDLLRDSGWHATLVRLSIVSEVDDFAACCAEHGVRRIDSIMAQLEELTRVTYPAEADQAERAAAVSTLLADSGHRDLLGCWAWYPWLGCVVHVLDRDDYFAVITNRNHDKITLTQQARLRGTRVGVVGLSVGGEAAVTVAQEHLCGHIVLADFDTLDLSNLNRLGAGVDELGLNKSVIVARRIARIDPYLGMTIFPSGVTDDASTGGFLDGLDLLLEECDSLPLKLSIRVEARRRNLNVIYAADERGFISVEPYGNDRSLQPFHGYVTEPPLPRVAYPSPIAFMRELVKWVGGWDGISTESRQSLARIGTGLVGYPQLASEARFAAGQLGHVARRLLLGTDVIPTLTQIDLDQLIPAR